VEDILQNRIGKTWGTLATPLPRRRVPIERWRIVIGLTAGSNFQLSILRDVIGLTAGRNGLADIRNPEGQGEFTK
jgi:hypothetical protein